MQLLLERAETFDSLRKVTPPKTQNPEPRTQTLNPQAEQKVCVVERILGFGVWGLGFGVWGLGFGVWGLGFGVCNV